MKRRIWFDWHSGSGFYVYLLLSFVLITGTLATISSELDWLTNASVRAKPTSASLDWGAMLDNSRASFPDARPITIKAPAAPWFNAELIALDPQDQRFRIYVAPATGQVVGTGRWLNWQRLFREVHRHLMLPVKVGVTIVCLLAFPLLLSFITSFAIYRRWWRGFFKCPKPHEAKHGGEQNQRRFWGDFHRLLGLWTLWFLPLIGITSIWYLVEQWGLAANYPKLPAVMSKPATQLSGEELNRMASDAMTAFPELRIERIILDSQDGNRVLLQGQASAVLVRPRANQITYDRANPAPLDIRRAEQLSVHQRISEAADPLHFGTFGGWLTRYLWFLFGLFLSALSISGTYIYGIRMARQYKSGDSQTFSPWRASWTALPGLSKWPSCMLILASLLLSGLIYLGAI